MRVKQGRVVKKGENQKSNVLSGMPRKCKPMVSDLIKTHRIMMIIAISKSLSNEMSLMIGTHQ